MTNKQIIIAVDGPAASGKGTLSRRLAKFFGLHYLDTGSLYRAVALMALDKHIALDDEVRISALSDELGDEVLNDPRLREPGVGEAASKIASLIPVRTALLEYQRAYARREPGAVLDGRDIGTVVCPDASVKLFVTASVDERARRRHNELVAGGADHSFEEIKAEIQRRDVRDSSRSAAPLVQSNDAHLLDTTNLDIETAMDAAVQLIKSAMADQD